MVQLFMQTATIMKSLSSIPLHVEPFDSGFMLAFDAAKAA
jgi:hypothetical protein